MKKTEIEDYKKALYNNKQFSLRYFLKSYVIRNNRFFKNLILTEKEIKETKGKLKIKRTKRIESILVRGIYEEREPYRRKLVQFKQTRIQKKIFKNIFRI